MASDESQTTEPSAFHVWKDMPAWRDIPATRRCVQCGIEAGHQRFEVCMYAIVPKRPIINFDGLLS